LFFDDGARRGIAIETTKDFARYSAIGPLRTVFVNHVEKSEFNSRCRLPCHFFCFPSLFNDGYATSRKASRSPRLVRQVQIALVLRRRGLMSHSWKRLDVLKVRSGQLAALAHNVVGERLPLIEIAHSGRARLRKYGRIRPVRRRSAE